jgi:uncharacterized membrane protein
VARYTGSMKITYETGIATLAQFSVLGLLNIGNSLNSIVTTCHTHGSNCLTNSLTSILFFMLAVIWFGMVWSAGYFAQKRRSKRLCLLLIGGEALTAIVALSNAKHHTDVLSLFTSLADIGFAVWVSLLAFRLIRARGGRIVASERSRKRHRPSTTL